MSAAVWRCALLNTCCLNYQQLFIPPRPHREISAGGLVLSVLNDHSNNCFLINIKGWMSADGDREKSVLAASSFFFFSFPSGVGGWKSRKVKARREKKWLRRADRALAVMERPHHSSSPSCHALLPSQQGLPSGAERGCVGERWLLCHSSPPLVLQIDSPDRTPPTISQRQRERTMRGIQSQCLKQLWLQVQEQKSVQT